MPDDDELARRRAEVRAAIVDGPRATGPQHVELVAPDGSLRGPFGLMVAVPGVGGPLQALGAAIRFETSLTAREREIAILVAAAATRSEFEQYAHERIGRAAGLDDDEIAGLRRGEWSFGDEREQAVAGLCHHLVVTPECTPGDRSRLGSGLDEVTIVEVTVLAGYYRTLAQLMGGAGIGAP
jgi:4-carboxymuconolactone decarboxylase